MKLTKFAQSCFLIEEGGTKILIDPGALLLDEKTIHAWMNPNFVLVTHKHFDHFCEEAVQKILSPKTKIFSTREVATFYPNTKFEIVKEGDVSVLGKIRVEVVKAVHGYTPLLKGGKEVNEGIGFILDNGKKRIYHTADTICFPNEYKCNVVMLPFNNHGVCMSPFESALFAKETEAELVLPMHNDNPKLPGDAEKMRQELEKNKLKYKFLKSGESIEL
ncbi:Beta-lactamase superfamily domain protein [uncultured archaeon]|nr:Beta-lactamase superfamily domain protein [uncultured archaeon]